MILVRRETSPEDLRGMIEAQGILTSTGGPTSHAAVVARGMGKSCIVGAAAVVISPDETSFSVNGQTVREGEWITLDGTSGNIYVGQVPTVEPELGDDFRTVMTWADEYRTMGVRADMTPQVARIDAHLLNRDGVARLCYCATALHTRPRGLTATREPLETGAEIYGQYVFGEDAQRQYLAKPIFEKLRRTIDGFEPFDRFRLKAAIR